MKINRNILVLFSIAILLYQSSACALPADTLKIAIISDPHICNLTGYHPTFVKMRADYGNGQDKLAQFLNTAPSKLDLNAIVITGDLIDYFEAETADGTMLGAQIEQFAALVHDCPVPLYMTLGNHDITNYWIDDADKKQQHQIPAEHARAVWIRTVPCFQQGRYYTRSYDVGATSYRFIFLDNGYHLHNGRYLDPPQLDWLQYQVVQSNDPVIIFMHKYLPVPDSNGDGIRFSKNEITIDDATCATGLLHVLNQHPQIKAILVGHGHRSVSEYLHMPAGHQILQTETAAFGQDKSNVRMLKFTEQQIIVMPCGDDAVEYVITVY